VAVPVFCAVVFIVTVIGLRVFGYIKSKGVSGAEKKYRHITFNALLDVSWRGFSFAKKTNRIPL